MTTSQKQSPLSDEEIAKLYVEASGDMPSQSLDSAILAAAHKAVDAKPVLIKPARSMAKHNWVQRWRLPMGIAATVVLSASLSSVMMHEKPEVITQPTVISSTDNASTAKMAAPAESPISANSPTESAPANEASTVSPDTTANEAPLNGSLDKAMPQKKTAENQATPQQSSMPKVDSKPAQVAKPFADEGAPVAATQTQAASAPAPTANPELAAAAPAAVLEKKEIETEQTKSVATRKQNEGVQTDAAGTTMAQQAPAELSPEAWLDNIKELRKTGKLDTAKQSLKAFKVRYPDYTLPKELLEPSE